MVRKRGSSCTVEVCFFALEFVQDARALGGVFLFGDQSLFEEVGQSTEADGDVLFRGSHP